MSELASRKKLRLKLVHGIMEQIGFAEASKLDEKGRCVDPPGYWQALHAVWEWLGPEGRAELDRQAGIDAYGKECEQAPLPAPRSVADFIALGREMGHDSLGIANDPEALAALDTMRSGSNG